MFAEPLIDLEKLLSLSIVHIYWLNRHNVYQGCNERQARFAGLASRFDIIGKRNCDLPCNANHPEMVTFVDNINLEVMTTGVFRIVEEPIILLDGTEVVFLSNKTPLRSTDGTVVGLLGISVDITSQKLQEAKLKSEKNETLFKLDYILAHIPAHIYWKDKNGKYLGSNDKQAKSLGLNYGYEVIGKTDLELPWKKSDAIAFRNNDLEVMLSGNMKTVEESAIFDGKEGVALSQKVPLRNSRGEIIGVLGVSIDITDRKRANQLQQEKEVTEQVSKAIEMLAGCIAHELRTPLCSINLNIDNLQKANKENKNECISNIKTAIKRSTSIIDMLLLKLRSLVTKKVHVDKFERHSIKDCVNGVLKEYPFYESEREKVVWDDNSNEDFIYIGDDLFTKHTLFNLIKNALKVIKEVERGKIYINLRPGREFNHLIFKDTAAGIPIEVLKSLFQAFNSGSKTGTGLGLAFCKMTMQSYGGDITCNSEEGKHTEFTLSFPKPEIKQ